MPAPRPDPWSQPPPPSRGNGWWVVVAVALLGALVFYLADRFPDAVADEGSRMNLLYRLAFLVMIGSGLVAHWKSRPGAALRHAGTWLMIGAVIFLAYSFRFEAGALWNRLAGELLPHRPTVHGEAVVVRARADGHFALEARVDGALVRFLVDTGASDVVLSPADAERLGFDTGTLRYTRTYHTANGTVAGAPVRLGYVAIGPLVVENVHASVNKAAMGQSLLGMSFLRRLSGYEVAGDRLVLHP